MMRQLALTAKICERDEQRRNDLLETLSFYPVGVIAVEDLIEIDFEGGEQEMDIFVQLMRICEACKCHSFQLIHKS